MSPSAVHRHDRKLFDMIRKLLNRRALSIAVLLATGSAVFAAGWGTLMLRWLPTGRNLAPVHVRLGSSGAAPPGELKVLGYTPWGGPAEFQKTGDNTWAMHRSEKRYLTSVVVAYHAPTVRENLSAEYSYDAGEPSTWRATDGYSAPSRDVPERFASAFRIDMPYLQRSLLPRYRGVINWRGDFNLAGRAFGATLLCATVLLTPLVALTLLIRCIRFRNRRSDRPMSRRYVLSAAGLIVLAAGIMLINTCTHPPENSYDSKRHTEAIRNSQNLYDLGPQPLPYQFEYSPVLYYYTLGKLNHYLEVLLQKEWHPFHLFRIYHILLTATALIGYAFLFAPRFVRNETARFVLLGGMLVIPNLYLTQLMVRPGHFVLYFAHLLFIGWFACDFRTRIGRERGITATWALLLMAMANSQHFAFPAVAVFLAWGTWELLCRAWNSDERWRRTATVAALVLVVSGVCAQHYALRYMRTGKLTDVNYDLPYFREFHEKQKGFDRMPLFTNLEFGELLARPNRKAEFDNGNNAFLPRLYGDMWADHWLYMSAAQVQDEAKPGFKRTLLLLAIPFSLFYLLAPLVFLFKRPLREWRDWPRVASFVWLLAVCLLILLVYKIPEPGKNSLVKFCYLMGYYWFPILPLAAWADKRDRWLKPVLVYLAVLALAALPLCVYPFGI